MEKKWGLDDPTEKGTSLNSESWCQSNEHSNVNNSRRKPAHQWQGREAYYDQNNNSGIRRPKNQARMMAEEAQTALRQSTAKSGANSIGGLCIGVETREIQSFCPPLSSL